MIVGVLALQGDFREHASILRFIGVEAMEVRSTEELRKCSALVIPGGESTTISTLLESTGLGEEIRKRVFSGMPVYGTCAGAIVLAKSVLRETRFKSLGLIDIDVERNAFGRQVDSFECNLEVKGVGSMNAVFIRSPRIMRAGPGVEVLASLGNEPVLVKQGNVIAGTFHPETARNSEIHGLFVKLIPKG